MKLGSVTDLSVVGCLPFERGRAGFALPLLAHPTNPNLHVVQSIDEYRNTISGYRVLEADDSLEVISIAGPVASVGGDIVYAFLTADGVAHAGTLRVLTPVLRAFASYPSSRKAVVLQILELIGTNQEKKIARANMRNVLVSRGGAGVARSFYEGSALRTALWDHLLASAPNADTAYRILKARSRLYAELDPNGNIRLDLAALRPSDLMAIDQNRIAAELAAEFGTPSPQEISADLDVRMPASETPQSAQIDAILTKIKSTGRQEERIAILIDEILKNRQVGISALSRYPRDRAKLANWALHELRTRLLSQEQEQRSPLFGVQISDENLVASMVPQFFTRQYPLARGELLFYLAKHLAKWPTVNAAIQRSLDRTASIFVNYYRKQIEELLSKERQS